MFYGWFEPTKGPKTFRYGYYVFRQWCSTQREKTGGPIAISERAYFWRYPKNVGVEFGNVTNFGPTKFNVLLLQLFSFFSRELRGRPKTLTVRCA